MTCNRQLTDLGNLTLKLKYSCSFSGIISQEHMHKGSLMLYFCLFSLHRQLLYCLHLLTLFLGSKFVTWGTVSNYS